MISGMPPPCDLCNRSFMLLPMCDLPVNSLDLQLPFWAPASPWVGINWAEAKGARTSADSRSLCPSGREALIDVAKSLQNLLFQISPEAPGHSSKGPHSNSSFFSYQLGTLGKSLDLKSLAFLICRTWTMWRQLSLCPLMAVGFREHIHTTHPQRECRYRDRNTGYGASRGDEEAGRWDPSPGCLPGVPAASLGESCSAPCLPFSHVWNRVVRVLLNQAWVCLPRKASLLTSGHGEVRASFIAGHQASAPHSQCSVQFSWVAQSCPTLSQKAWIPMVAFRERL